MMDENIWWEKQCLLPFQAPCSILICGPSQNGKTHLTYRILKESKGMFSSKPIKVVYCYSVFQPLFVKMEEEIENIILYKGLPDSNDINDWSEKKEQLVLILDDLLADAANSPDIMNLFTVGCHHRNISVIFLMQNIFPPGKCIRTISLNASYIILLRNHRDKHQISILGRQILPGQTHFLSAYQQAVSKMYGYLLVDLSPHTDKTYLLRTNIFIGEDNHIFVPK